MSNPCATDMTLKPLLIAGGLSTRMGTAKHLLACEDGRSLYQHTLEQLHIACPKAEILYISLRDESQLASLDLDHARLNLPPIQPLYDDDDSTRPASASGKSQGPAAGLLAAYEYSPVTTWLVAGCDYPLLTASAFQRLIQEYVRPVTCYSNAQGYCEPLLAIWGPAALKRLQDNVARGKLGPSNVIREMGGKMIRPEDESWIMGANTKEEWDAAMEIARSKKTHQLQPR